MWHILAYKLATNYKLTLMYFLVNIHINNQSTLYKVNSVALQEYNIFLAESLEKRSSTALSAFF
jgi:hypothetical protein